MASQSALILRMALLLLQLVYSTGARVSIIPSNTDVLVGEQILLLCKAGGEGDITWQKEGEDIDDEDKVSLVDETSSKLIINKATMEDTGRYTCLCNYESGSHDSGNIQIYVYVGPSFGSTTTYHEFLEGKEGTVPCQVSGQPAVDAHWIRDKEEISSQEGRRVRQLPDHTLFIENVKREDAGTYVCGANIRGRPIHIELPVSVVVNAPPTVRLREEEKKVMAGPEANVTFLCLVDGLPKPNITWIMPVPRDSSRHHFNSDRSELTITSVARGDYGEYICTATNKIAESSGSIILQVFETPEVFVSAEQQRVPMGEGVSVSCNVSGHPQPELHWLNKHSGHTVDSTSGRVRVVDGALVIDEVVPSDGGLYSCMAVSSHGNASRDVAIHTQPGPPHYLSVSPGPTSVMFSLKTSPISGGTAITIFVLQWRQSAEEKWNEITVPASDPLALTTLKPYTLYTVRLAALNAVGLGQFSETNSVRTQGIREPDSPVLMSDDIKIDGNSFSIKLKQIDDGGTPLHHFDVRYRIVHVKDDKESSDWTETQMTPDANSIHLRDLSPSDYQLEVTAVNANGSSSPARFNFTIAEPAVKASGMTKGSVVGIVILIFLVVFLVVDATCCYRNRCGLLMSISSKIFGQKVPGLKMLEEGEGATNGEVKLNGLSTPRGSMQQTGLQTHTVEGGQSTEVTCDKAHLTKNEKTQPGRNLSTADA